MLEHWGEGVGFVKKSMSVCSRGLFYLPGHLHIYDPYSLEDFVMMGKLQD